MKQINIESRTTAIKYAALWEELKKEEFLNSVNKMIDDLGKYERVVPASCKSITYTEVAEADMDEINFWIKLDSLYKAITTKESENYLTSEKVKKRIALDSVSYESIIENFQNVKSTIENVLANKSIKYYEIHYRDALSMNKTYIDEYLKLGETIKYWKKEKSFKQKIKKRKEKYVKKTKSFFTTVNSNAGTWALVSIIVTAVLNIFF